SADGDFELVGAREVEGGRDVGPSEAAHDDGGPPIDERVEAQTGSVVLDVARHHHVARERTAELVEALRDPRLGLCHLFPPRVVPAPRILTRAYRAARESFSQLRPGSCGEPTYIVARMAGRTRLLLAAIAGTVFLAAAPSSQTAPSSE